MHGREREEDERKCVRESESVLISVCEYPCTTTCKCHCKCEVDQKKNGVKKSCENEVMMFFFPDYIF